MNEKIIVSPTKDNFIFGPLGAQTHIMQAGLLMLDSTTALKLANTMACELLGCANTEDLKGQWDVIKPLFGLDKDLPPATTQRSLKVKFQIKNKTCSLSLEVHALEESCGYLVLIGDRKIADELENELLLACHMRSQMYFHGALAHDLRAPLNAIQITLELLSGIGGQDIDLSRQQRYVAVLKEELIRLNRILATLLDNGVPSLSSASEEFDLRATIEEIAALLNPQAMRQRVHLECRLSDREIRVSGYRGHVKHALLNVAINGLEATPHGGRLRIDMRDREASVDVIVRDDGPGIPAERLDDIYHACFTTKKDGSGMGLYFARLVLESHGGGIEGRNEPGAGACFTLTLPLVKISGPDKNG